MRQKYKHVNKDLAFIKSNSEASTKFIKNSSSYQGTYCNFISTPSTNSAANLAPAEGETSIMNSSTEKITQIFFLANKILPPLLARMFFPPQDIIFFFSSFFFVCEPNAYFKIK